jgi:hypothetical protein
VTNIRRDIVTAEPEMNTTRPYFLQMASGETIPVLTEVLAELLLGRSALKLRARYERVVAARL